MKTIGLLGGMSWASTIPYYRVINDVVNQRLGGLHSARLVLCNVNFDEIELLQRANAWNEIGKKLAGAASVLKMAGAESIVLCSHTMHKVSDQIEDIAGIPLLHIADAVAGEMRRTGLHTVGLIGSRFTMEQDFYKGRLEDKHGFDVVLPSDKDRFLLHKIIYEELCRGIVRNESSEAYRRILRDLTERGAQGVVLGCTEIATFLGTEVSAVPTFDGVTIHARKAAEWSLGVARNDMIDLAPQRLLRIDLKRPLHDS